MPARSASEWSIKLSCSANWKLPGRSLALPAGMGSHASMERDASTKRQRVVDQPFVFGQPETAGPVACASRWQVQRCQRFAFPSNPLRHQPSSETYLAGTTCTWLFTRRTPGSNRNNNSLIRRSASLATLPVIVAVPPSMRTPTLRSRLAAGLWR